MIWGEFQGFFPPSPLSILSSGFRDYLPIKAITSFDGYVKTEKKLQDSNLQSVLFGKIDFVFIVTNFLSLLALVFTFGSISSESEHGTLKLLLSNPVPRWKVIIAKILGNYFVFIAPFLVSIIIGLLVVQMVTGISFIDSPWQSSFLLIIIFTFIFLFMFFNLGIWISIVSKNTVTSIVILLFIWIFFSLGIPRISPMIAQAAMPVKTEDAFLKERQFLNEEMERKFDKDRSDLLKKEMAENNIVLSARSGFSNLNEIAEKQTNYTKVSQEMEKKFNAKLTQELTKMEQDYNHSKFSQMVIASNLSRISPVSSYTFLTTEFSQTGMLEISNRTEAANRFQYQVDQDVYKFLRGFRYVYDGLVVCGSTSSGVKRTTQNNSVPVINQYKPVTISAIFQKTWPDLLLMVWYTIIFFTGVFVSFLRTDIR